MKAFIIRVLKKIGTATRTDMIYLARFGSYLVANRIASAAITFFLSIAYANLLSKAVFGNLRYVLSVISIIGVTSLFGVDRGVVQAVANGQDGTLKSGFITKLKWSLLGCLASLAAGIFFYFFEHEFAIGLSLITLAAFLPIYQSAPLFQSYLVGKKKFGENSLILGLVRFFSALIILATLFVSPSLLPLVFANVVGVAVLNAGAMLWVIKKYHPSGESSAPALKFGKHTSLLDLISQISVYLDRLLVFHFLGPVELAIYSFAQAPAEQLKGAWKPFIDLVVPKYVERTEQEIRSSIHHKMLLTGGVSLLAILAYIPLAPWLFKIFFPQYLAAVPYSQVYIFSFIAQPVLISTAALEAKLKTRLYYKISLTLNISQIITLVAFGYLFGLWGIIGVRVGINFLRLFLHSYFIREI